MYDKPITRVLISTSVTHKHWGYGLALGFKPRTPLMKTLPLWAIRTTQLIVSSQVKRESNLLHGLEVMGILHLFRWMAMVQHDKTKNGSPKPQAQGKRWHQGKVVPGDELTSWKIQWNDQEAIEGSKSFSLKIFKLSVVMLNIISKSTIF